MRLPLIILASTLAFTACNKSENHIKPRPYIAEEKVVVTAIEKKEESKPAVAPVPLTIAHAQGQSILREKLMLKMINDHLEKKAVKNENIAIAPTEEFALKNKEQGLTSIERGEYLDKSKKQARVVLSYSDQVMVFFVDPGLKLKTLREFLVLKEEPQKTLVMLGAKDGETVAGKAVYFLSTDKKEILNHDISVYNETFHYGKFSESLNLRLNANQKIEAFISYDYLVQTTDRKIFSLQGTCGRHANNCPPCKWIRPVPSQTMIREQPNSIEALGMQVRVNDTLLTTQELKLSVGADNVLRMPLTGPTNLSQSSYTVHFSFAGGLVQRTTVMEPRSEEGACSSVFQEMLRPVVENFQTKTYATLKLLVWGHGDVMNDFKLE